VTWDINKGIFYWDAASGKRLRQFAPSGDQFRRIVAPAGGVNSLTFSSDGKLLALACLDDTIRICDQATEKEIRKIDSHADFVRGFSPDGALLVTANEAETTIWDVASGRPGRKIAARGTCCCFSPDGSIMALRTGFNGAVHLWDVATGKE